MVWESHNANDIWFFKLVNCILHTDVNKTITSELSSSIGQMLNQFFDGCQNRWYSTELLSLFVWIPFYKELTAFPEDIRTYFFFVKSISDFTFCIFTYVWMVHYFFNMHLKNVSSWMLNWKPVKKDKHWDKRQHSKKKKETNKEREPAHQPAIKTEDLKTTVSGILAQSQIVWFFNKSRVSDC